MSSKKINNREVELKTLMLKRGIKIKDVVKSSGLSQPMVSLYIQGKRNSPRLDRVFNRLKRRES